MYFSAATLISVLCASTLTSASTLAERRAARARKSNPLARTSTEFAPAAGNASHVEFSSNWAGAILTSPPSGQKFTTVTGRFNVPTPKRPSGSGSGSFAASAWVGIDGDTYTKAILQSGIDFTIGSNGAVSYDAWYEWFPNFAIDFSNFPLSAGQTVQVTITSQSSTAGTVVLENVSTGHSVTQKVTAPSSSAPLGGQNAEWIVEDFDEGGSQVSFASFNPVTFTSASAGTGSSTINLGGATIIEIESSSGQVLTDVSIPSTSSVTVTHT